MTVKEIVDNAYAMKAEDLEWKPLYPNNMPVNGLKGYYCLILHKDEDGIVSGRKYTITFQYKLADELCRTDEIDRYILFEKSYYDIKGAFSHPEPTNNFVLFDQLNETNTLTAYDVNDYGSFVYAYEDIETAKRRALRQYQAIYGYAMSHIVEDSEDERNNKQN